MDIERMKKLLSSGIEAGNRVKAVREVIKTYNKRKQDMYDDTSEILKPSLDIQKEVKKSIDDQQDKLIEQLQKNQKAITSGLEDIALMSAAPQALPAPTDTTKLPVGYKPTMMDDMDDIDNQPIYKSNLDQGFTGNEIERLMSYNLAPPSQILESHVKKAIDVNEYEKNIGEEIKKLGRTKGSLSKTKKQRDKNQKQIDGLTEDIKLLQKYKQRLSLIEEGSKTIGQGIYTQKKRNAYKI